MLCSAGASALVHLLLLHSLTHATTCLCAAAAMSCSCCDMQAQPLACLLAQVMHC
jgi:hypothetical protein